MFRSARGFSPAYRPVGHSFSTGHRMLTGLNRWTLPAYLWIARREVRRFLPFSFRLHTISSKARCLVSKLQQATKHCDRARRCRVGAGYKGGPESLARCAGPPTARKQLIGVLARDWMPSVAFLHLNCRVLRLVGVLRCQEDSFVSLTNYLQVIHRSIVKENGSRSLFILGKFSSTSRSVDKKPFFISALKISLIDP